MSADGTRTEPNARQRAIDEENWNRLKADPLAYIRELALAHHEKLRDEQQPATVLVLDHYRREAK